MTIAVCTESYSVSHGTLRSEDLLAAFAGELRRFNSDHALIAEADAVMLLDGLGYSVMADGEAVSELIGELQDALDAHAGDGFRFGAHEGDGSDFGFWPVEDDAA